LRKNSPQRHREFTEPQRMPKLGHHRKMPDCSRYS